MHIGLIGLGKMGMNLGKNVMDHTHHVTAFDVNPAAVEELVSYGAKGATSMQELVESLPQPRVIWLMVLMEWWILC